MLFLCLFLEARYWKYPELSEEELNRYKEKTDDISQYGIDNYNFNVTNSALYNIIDKRIMNLDASVKREYTKFYIAYKLDSNFADIIVQSNRLKIYVNMKFEDLVDLKGICRDVSDVGVFGNEDVEFIFENLEDIDVAMDIIEQGFNIQFE